MGVFDLACRRVIQPLWARRESRQAARFRQELARRQFDPPEVIRARQFSALRRIVRHAANTIPYYRTLFEQFGIDPVEIRTIEDLQVLPVLTKADIRREGPNLLSTGLSRAGLTRKKTSGSTGVPLEVKLDPAGLQWKRACTLRADEWSGWQRGQRVAKVWGNPEFRQFGIRGRLRNWLYERSVYLDTLQLTPETIDRFARQIARQKPELIFGHAHSVFLLAEHIQNRQLPRYQPHGIITTAMVLHDWQRRRIEAVFGCPVTNRYGCEEVSLIACECSEHRGLHVNADSVLVETIADGRPARPGELGAIVVTDLSNFAMPLIRYQVGDMGVLSDRECLCGRGLPLLESIEGREADYVVTAAGQMISGISLTENFAVLVPGVAQIQIVQEAVDGFLFRIVRDSAWGPASELKIAELVTERFGSATRSRCEFVDVIPREPSGKYRFCISHVLAERQAAA
jgi:phenylacetate-coenzyme A ligase PaaK-like adenylate-forming protein